MLSSPQTSQAFISVWPRYPLLSALKTSSKTNNIFNQVIFVFATNRSVTSFRHVRFALVVVLVCYV